MPGHQRPVDDEFSFIFLSARLVRLVDILIHDETNAPLTIRQYRTLRRVLDGGETLTEVARHSTLSLPVLSATISVLEERGLIRKVPKPEDGRSKRLLITQHGREAVLVVEDWLTRFKGRMFEDIDVEYLAAFRTVVDIIHHRVYVELRDRRRDALSDSG